MKKASLLLIAFVIIMLLVTASGVAVANDTVEWVTVLYFAFVANFKWDHWERADCVDHDIWHIDGDECWPPGTGPGGFVPEAYP
jgi:hypothetical protein